MLHRARGSRAGASDLWVRDLVILAAFLLAACSPRALPANPALWEVTGPAGEHGWLFGTIHALDRPAAWRTARVEDALRGSDRIVVEIAGLADRSAMAGTFARLATSSGHPPLSQRVPPALRDRLDTLLRQAGQRDDAFADTETWAAALTLARAQDPRADSGYGIDRAVIAAAGTRPVVELEGAAAQLGIFDALPERDQRALLAAVVADGGAIDEGSGLADAWRRGDMAPIEAETRRGILADPDLRAALFVRRNRAWATRIGAMLRARQRPFVAVGAAHMAGPEGLPALLAAQGFRVRRIE